MWYLIDYFYLIPFKLKPDDSKLYARQFTTFDNRQVTWILGPMGLLSGEMLALEIVGIVDKSPKEGRMIRMLANELVCSK